jgi:hypothetical protein
MASQFLLNPYTPYKHSHRITGRLYKWPATNRYSRSQLPMSCLLLLLKFLTLFLNFKPLALFSEQIFSE